MEVRFAELTRGSGKIYCHLALEGAPEGATVEVASHTESGDQLPATCVSVPGVTGPVCVLPVLDVTQNVSVRVLDASGAAIAHAEKSLSATLAACGATTFRSPSKGAARPIPVGPPPLVRSCGPLGPGATPT